MPSRTTLENAFLALENFKYFNFYSDGEEEDLVGRNKMVINLYKSIKPGYIYNFQLFNFFRLTKLIYY